MTTKQAAKMSKAVVYTLTAKQGPQWYTVTCVRGGYVVVNCEDSRRSYRVRENAAGHLFCECPAFDHNDFCKHQVLVLDARHEVESIRDSARLDKLLGKAEQQQILTREEIIRRGQEAIDLLFPDTRPWTPGNKPLPEERTAIAIDTTMGTDAFDPYNTYELPANARLIAA